jgi:GNAT superfamily N-acetyltransferase
MRDPHGTFVAPGGQVFFVIEAGGNGEVVGTCAVAPHPGHAGEFHLSKMAVADAARGRGYGALLLRAALDFARGAGAHAVTLVSNRRLTPALTLYAKHGFREVPLDPDEQYARADIKMRRDLTATERREKPDGPPATP